MTEDRGVEVGAFAPGGCFVVGRAEDAFRGWWVGVSKEGLVAV